MRESERGSGASVVVLGAGFVGAAVRDALARRHRVSVLDLPTHPALAERDDDARRLLLDHLDEVGAGAVVNCSGLLRGTDAELEVANSAWPRWLVEVLAGTSVRFVHLGSASEYGDPGDAAPIPEDRPARPSGTYGETKWAGSSAVLAARDAGMDALVVRGFNLVSAEPAPVSPLHQFRADVDALPDGGGEVELWWPATVRDFVQVSDLGEAVARLVATPEVPPVVNVCSGVGLRFDDIVRAVAVQRGKPVTIRSLDRPGIGAVVGDPSLLEQVTGLRPEMSADLLARTICGIPAPAVTDAGT